VAIGLDAAKTFLIFRKIVLALFHSVINKSSHQNQTGALAPAGGKNSTKETGNVMNWGSYISGKNGGGQCR
jgi:hypothetical protein